MSLLLAAGVSNVSGTIAWTQEGDSWSLVGVLKASGAIAFTQGSDTWALTEMSLVSGSIAWTQGADAWALTGALQVAASVGWTQESDAWAVAAVANVSGAIALLQAPDSWAIQGVVIEAPIPDVAVYSGGGGSGGKAYGDDVEADILAAIARLEQATEAVEAAEVEIEVEAVSEVGNAPPMTQLHAAIECAQALDEIVMTSKQHKRLQSAIADAEYAQHKVKAREEADRAILKARRRRVAVTAILLFDEGD